MDNDNCLGSKYKELLKSFEKQVINNFSLFQLQKTTYLPIFTKNVGLWFPFWKQFLETNIKPLEEMDLEGCTIYLHMISTYVYWGENIFYQRMQPFKSLSSNGFVVNTF